MRDVVILCFIFVYLLLCVNSDIAQEESISVEIRSNQNLENKVSDFVLSSADKIDSIPIPQGYEFEKKVLAKVTAYEPSYISCGNSADGKTSIMHNAWKMKGCAVASEAIPYGSLIWIPGVGFKEADDTGSAMKKSWQRGIYHIDLRMQSVYQAKKWGVKWLEVYLFRKKSQ
jgi:3D (Asp-Asp-Asp) domain-containing protein